MTPCDCPAGRVTLAEAVCVAVDRYCHGRRLVLCTAGMSPAEQLGAIAFARDWTTWLRTPAVPGRWV